MTLRSNNEIARGFFPITEGCKGPYISTSKGSDSPCCARCHTIRIGIYTGNGKVLTNPIVLEYVKRLGQDQHSSFSCSQCDKPMIFVPNGKTTLEIETVRSEIRSQCELFKAMKLVDKEVIIGFTAKGFPVIFPSDNVVVAESEYHRTLYRDALKKLYDVSESY